MGERHSVFGQGRLDAIRQAVRGDDSPSSSKDDESSEEKKRDEQPDESEPSRSSPAQSSSASESSSPSSGGHGSALVQVVQYGALAVAVPLWGPHALLDDHFDRAFSFSSFPYGSDGGYATTRGIEGPRPWLGQFAIDYTTTFDNLDSIGGHLVLSTSTRLGFDVSAEHFQEKLSGNRYDGLWLGDGNLVFCFAQNESMQWRTGLGINWLDDTRQTDVGFNFTYGFDWFPQQPWIASASIDWGALGHSNLFHFRCTVGAILNRFEVYTGYEHYDIDRVSINSLIGGVRIWF